MSEWVKIIPAKGNNAAPPGPRFCKHTNGAFALIPDNVGFAVKDRVSIYTDGNGRVAYERDSTGLFRVGKHKANTLRLSIPAQIANGLPRGTHKIGLSAVGKRLICDLRAEPAVRITAE